MSKLEKLIGLVSGRVEVEDLKRLVNGDLSDIGDAIVNGKSIMVSGIETSVFDIHFNGVRASYQIKKDTILINGVECVAPEKELPEKNNYYYFIADGKVCRGENTSRKLDDERLYRGIWLKKEYAQTALNAMLKPIREYLK